MRPQAPELHLAVPDEAEKTNPENPFAKLAAVAMREAFEALKPELIRDVTIGVVNAIGPRLLELEQKTRTLEARVDRCDQRYELLLGRVEEVERRQRNEPTIPAPGPEAA